MGDVLELERVADVVSQLQPDWGGDAGVLYVQRRTVWTADLVGNKVLRPYLGDSREVPEESVGSWVRALMTAKPMAAVGTADLSTLAWLIDRAETEQWEVRLRRVVRLGDCRLASSFGTGAEQAAAERLLEINPSPRNQIALLEIAGTGALFSETSFKWEADDEYRLKSCYEFDAVCSSVIPSLVAAKGVQRILVAGKELMHRLLADPRLSRHASLLVRADDPDESAETLRRKVIVEVARRSRQYEPAPVPKRRWLDVMRSTVAPTSATPAAETWSLYYRALNATLQKELEGILERAESLSSDPKSGAFAAGIVCLVNSKLGRTLNSAQRAHLLATGAETELWWHEAIRAEALAWATGNGSGEWLESLGERGFPALAWAAEKSAEAYARVREAAAKFLPEALTVVVPFQDLETHQKYHHHLKKVCHALAEGTVTQGAGPIELAPLDVPGVQESIRNALAKENFYQGLDEVFWHIGLEQAIGFGKYAKQLWGESPEQRKCDLRAAFAADDFEEAARIGEACTNERPDDYSSWYYFAEALQNLKRLDRAIDAYGRMRSILPERQFPIREIARCRWIADDNSAAIAMLESIPAQDREPSTTCLLARIQKGENRFDDVLRTLAPLGPEDLDERTLAALLVSKVALDPSPAACASLLAQRERLSDRWPDAIADAAILLADRGDAGLAVKALQPALEFGKGWGNAVMAFAKIAEHVGRHDEADSLFSRLEDPDEDATATYATILHARGKFEASLDVATKGLARWPDNLPLLLLSGELGDLLGKPEGGHFQRIIDLVEAMEPSYCSSFEKCYLATAFDNVGNASAADALIDAWPRPRPYWLLYSAMASAVAGKAERSAAQYKKAVAALDPLGSYERATMVRSHLADIEVYGKRGRLPDWERFLAQAKATLDRDTRKATT